MVVIRGFEMFEAQIKAMSDAELVSQRQQLINELHTVPMEPLAGALAEKMVEQIEIEQQMRKPVSAEVLAMSADELAAELGITV